MNSDLAKLLEDACLEVLGEHEAEHGLRYIGSDHHRIVGDIQRRVPEATQLQIMKCLRDLGREQVELLEKVLRRSTN
jgi:hypothetical protein